jgi:uncharacterized membrane protein YsdA (DUF1294 family)
MSELLWGIGAYLVAVNTIAFICYAVDKYRAHHNRMRNRIPEDSLVGLAAIGGSIGSLLAMYTLRHKTKHRKFKYGIPAILLLQIAAVVGVMWYFSVWE